MPTEPRIDLNVDVGEGFGAYSFPNEAEVLPFVTSANIACGFHAGDPKVMDRTVGLAVRAGVTIGAHPGFWDLRGFGRRVMSADPEEVETDVLYQVGALMGFALSYGARVVHVKPHGSLYNQAATDDALARAIARGVARAGKELILIGLASSPVMRKAAEYEGLRFAAEAFADRAYNPDGTLQTRRVPGAVITDPKAAADQALKIAREGRVIAVDGTEIPVQAETLCLHGDNPMAAEIAWAVRQALEGAGVQIRSLVS